jgi:hypothetical protein
MTQPKKKMNNLEFPSGSDPDALEILERAPFDSYQDRWLVTQSQQLNIKKSIIIWEALREWLSRYPNLEFPPGTPLNVIPKALEEFIARHREEFLPVPPD